MIIYQVALQCSARSTQLSTSTNCIRNRQVEMRDFVAEAAKAKDVDDLRRIYNEARQSNVHKDILASITALADGLSE